MKVLHIQLARFVIRVLGTKFFWFKNGLELYTKQQTHFLLAWSHLSFALKQSAFEGLQRALVTF